MLKKLLIPPLAVASILALGSDRSQTASAAAPVRNVVLVQGAFADGSSYAKVIPLLRAKGLRVTAVQNPLSSLADDVAATKRAIALQDGPVVLVGHSWGGMVISEAGNDAKVAALVYIAALVPDEGQATSDVLKPYPPTPRLAEATPDAASQRSLCPLRPSVPVPGGTPEAQFETHPLRRPIMFLQGRELGSPPVRIRQPLIPERAGFLDAPLVF